MTELKPCPLSDEQISEVFDMAKAQGADLNDALTFAFAARRLLSQAVPPVSEAEPVAEVFGYDYGGTEIHFTREILPHGTKLYAAPPVTATPSEAVKELVEALRCAEKSITKLSVIDCGCVPCRGSCRTGKGAEIELEARMDYAAEAASQVSAALAKHGTQAATPAPPDDGTIACSSCGLTMAESRLLYSMKSATPSPSDLTAYGEKVREHIASAWDGCMYDAPGETVDVGADIRSMPLPAQSEGGSHGN